MPPIVGVMLERKAIVNSSSSGPPPHTPDLRLATDASHVCGARQPLLAYHLTL